MAGLGQTEHLGGIQGAFQFAGEPFTVAIQGHPIPFSKHLGLVRFHQGNAVVIADVPQLAEVDVLDSGIREGGMSQDMNNPQGIIVGDPAQAFNGFVQFGTVHGFLGWVVHTGPDFRW